MLCVCGKESVSGVLFFVLTFARGFRAHVTVRYPMLDGMIITFCGCKIWNVLCLNKKRNLSDLNDWTKGLMNSLISSQKSYESLTN